MKLTDKEQFLLDIQAYLMNGGKMHDESTEGKQRTQREALEIMDDKERFSQIDVIEDELDFFGLELDELFD